MKKTGKLKAQTWRAIMGTDAVPADENEFLKALYGSSLSRRRSYRWLAGGSTGKPRMHRVEERVEISPSSPYASRPVASDDFNCKY